MQTTIMQEQGVTHVMIQGRLDTTTAPQLEQVVASLQEVTVLCFDCQQMEYISSAGLRVILTTHKQLAARGGRLSLRGLNPEVQAVFDLTGFSKILTIE